MDWIDYREELGIGFNDYGKFQLLKNKICTFLRYWDTCVPLPDLLNPTYINYFILTGCNTPHMDINGVLQSMTFSDSMEDLISKFIAFTNTAHDHISNEQLLKEIKDFLPSALNSLHIPYTLFEDQDGFFIFPKGAKELDDALVSQPLEWLSAYPTVRVAWIKALKDYADVTLDNASDVADKLRKALERFFQEFFGGNKSLENYKIEYGIFLKDNNVPKEIRGNFETMLQAYANYINNYAKHTDRADINVLEYILYQTGNIMRLLITLKQNEKGEKE